MLKINKLNKGGLPFYHLSPSSIIEFLVNEKSFFKKYIKGEFEEKTGPALIIGTAFHRAMEFYYKAKIERKQDLAEGKEILKEIPTREQIIQHAVNEMNKLFGLNERRGYQKLIKIKSGKLKKNIDFDVFYENYMSLMQFDWAGLNEIKENFENETDPGKKEEIRIRILKLNDLTSRAKHFLKEINLEVDEELGLYNEELNEYKNYYIEWGETGSKEKAQTQLEIGINNYLEYEPLDFEPLVAEMSEISEFQDFDGNDMCIPMKGKPDLIAELKKEKEDIIIDYKLVTSFGERTGAYEIQARSYYFIAQAITGRKPKEMWYIETIKKNLNPTSGMRKPEIQGLCVTHNIEYLPKDTIPVLTEKLLEAGVLEIPSGVNIIKINFEETPEIIQTFLEIYKEILNRSYYFFIEKTLKFLPNPKADFTGIQTWQEFKMEVISEINPIEDYMTAFDEKSKIKFEF